MTMSAECLAARVTGYGEPLRIDHVPRPVAGPGEVLVQVAAGGVNPVDWKVRDGLRRERMPLALPVVAGCDIAGTVLEVGEGVQGFARGQAVCAMVGLYGGFQQCLAVAADKLAPVPAGLSLADAASVPLAALTAWQALQLARPVQGERVLIHAAAGGVGMFALQLARILELKVTATASVSAHEQVLAWGADAALDYRTQAFEQAVGTVDIVLDLVGGETQARSWQLLGEGGRLITTVALPPGDVPGRGRGVHAERVGVRPLGADLRRIVAWIGEGRIRTQVQKRFALEQAQDALEFNKAGGARGKTVIDFPSP